MTSLSTSSSEQAAGRHLDSQLREIRTAAGISGVEFARRAGWRIPRGLDQVDQGQLTVADASFLVVASCGLGQRRSESGGLPDKITGAETSSVVRIPQAPEI